MLSTFVLDLAQIVFFTGVLAAVTVLAGVPFPFVLRRAIPALPLSLGVCWLFGTAWISILSWYAFAAGLSPVWAYRLAIGLGLLACVLGLARTVAGSREGRNVARRCLVDWGGDGLAFFVCVLIYSALSASKIKHNSLPWLTIGNNDLLAYLKMGGYILHFPNNLQFSDVKNLYDFATTDVFGAFNLISFGGFAARGGVEHFAIPTMGFAVGVAGMAIVRCSRRIFRLGVILSLLLAAVTLSCPLLSYVTLNYFLAQVLLVAVMLTTILVLAESREGALLDLGVAVSLGITSSTIVMLCYPPWLVQYLCIVSGAAAVLSARRDFSVVRWAASVALRTAGGLALLSVVLGAVSPTRMIAALTRLAVVSQANVAGWPLSFVNLDLLLGWPDDWRFHDAEVPVIAQSLAVIILVAVVFSMLRRVDHGPGRFARAFLVTTFASAGAAYLAIWCWFGASYQQWKFATTIPLGFGFVISAAVLHILLMDTSRSNRIVIRCGAASVLALIVAGNVQQFYGRWSIGAYDFPSSLRNARAIDLTPGVASGYVKMDDYLARMGASVFVRDKPVTFSGPTYWGDGSPPPTGIPFVEVEAACHAGKPDSVDYVAQRVEDETLPVLPLDTRVPFKANIDACVNLNGFGAAESEGRWTDGRQASIRLACGCDLSRDHVGLVVEARAFLIAGRIETQRVFFRVNGAAPQEFDLTSTTDRKLSIQVPAGSRGDNTIDIQIDLPDAMSPTLVGSQDTRTLGLSVISLELRQTPPPP